MKYRVAVTCETFTDLEMVWQAVRDAGIDMDVDYHGTLGSTAEYIEALCEADGAMVATKPLTTQHVMDECPKLKVVSRMGVGVDSIDLNAATELGVLVCNVPGENTGEVAEHAVAMLLAMARRLPQSIEYTRRGDWGRDTAALRDFQMKVERVAGKSVGIIGLGNIGKAFAARIRAFGPSSVIAFDKYVSQATADIHGVQMVSLDYLLAQSDFISIHAPHTPETDKLINAETLSKMKKSAVLINCSRGGLVDQAALRDALEKGMIAYAGLDVTEQEPIASDDPLLSLPNAFITPHLAGFSPIFLEECGRKQAENVVNALTAMPLHGIANPDVIKRIAVMRNAGASRWDNVPER